MEEESESVLEEGADETELAVEEAPSERLELGQYRSTRSRMQNRDADDGASASTALAMKEENSL